MGCSFYFYIFNHYPLRGQVSISWPEWARRISERVGQQPGMLLVMLVFVLGALSAALVPLTEVQILLNNPSGHLEVRHC